MKIFTLIIIALLINTFNAFAGDDKKVINLDQLGKVQISNIEKTKPDEKPPEKGSSLKVSMTCKDESGVNLKEGDMAYTECLNKTQSNLKNSKSDNANQKSLNFSFGN